MAKALTEQRLNCLPLRCVLSNTLSTCYDVHSVPQFPVTCSINQCTSRCRPGWFGRLNPCTYHVLLLGSSFPHRHICAQLVSSPDTVQCRSGSLAYSQS